MTRVAADFIAFPILQAIQIAKKPDQDSLVSLGGMVNLQGAWCYLIGMIAALIAWWISCRLLNTSYPWQEGAVRMKSQRRF